FHKYEISELILRERRYSDRRDGAVSSNPFVILGVFQHTVTSRMDSGTLVTRRNERKTRDYDRKPLAADLGKQPGSWLARAGSNIAHRERCAEARTEAAGSHVTCGQGVMLGRKQGRAGAHGGAPFRPQPNAAAGRAACELLHRNFSPGEAVRACAAGAPRGRQRPFQRRLPP